MRIPTAVPILAAFVVLLLLLVLLLGGRAEGRPPDCFDQLLMEWNSFATDANNHMHVNDVKRANHEKAHAKLDREWEALHALACW
jgi:hypothetical protein